MTPSPSPPAPFDDSLRRAGAAEPDGAAAPRRAASGRRRALILGVNGFIGSHLAERVLAEERWEICGMDLRDSNLGPLRGHPRFEFRQGDISIERRWVEAQIAAADVVLPLVAIATPLEYIRNPLRVFELDFEENLRIVRDCVRHGVRVVFPSTSEVYGKCSDASFDEERSDLVTGPIHRQRWIYSCAKQLLDRVIWAYGQQGLLRFTLFRPFNWIGPRLDSLEAARLGSSRAITRIILGLIEGTPIALVDGGTQRRCFTDVRDGVECLLRIMDGGAAPAVGEPSPIDEAIVNIGHPGNDASIRELAELLLRCFDRHPMRGLFPPFAGFRAVDGESFYGPGYEDVQRRRPSIENARRLLGWTPSLGLAEAAERTLDWFLRSHAAATAAERPADPRRG